MMVVRIYEARWQLELQFDAAFLRGDEEEEQRLADLMDELDERLVAAQITSRAGAVLKILESTKYLGESGLSSELTQIQEVLLEGTSDFEAMLRLGAIQADMMKCVPDSRAMQLISQVCHYFSQ